jgi:hypothetical protein
MTRPEIARSGYNPIGDNTPPGDPDERTNQPTDTVGTIPEDNLPGHAPEHDQDKPFEKFAQRFGGNAANADSNDE